MRILKNMTASALAALFAFSASNVAAQEQDPPPPSGLICNGVTCEGFMNIGGEWVYVIFPDPGGEAPYPP